MAGRRDGQPGLPRVRPDGLGRPGGPALSGVRLCRGGADDEGRLRLV